MLDRLTSADFSLLLNQQFHLSSAADLPPLDFTLIQVKEVGEAVSAESRRPFSLIFRGPTTPVLPQRIYPLEHAALGTLDIFIVAIGPDSAGMRYQAIFS